MRRGQLIASILCLHKSIFKIKGVVLFVIAGSLYIEVTTERWLKGKLIGLLPMTMNFIGPRFDTLEEFFGSSNINRLIISLFIFQMEKRSLRVVFLDPS